MSATVTFLDFHSACVFDTVRAAEKLRDALAANEVSALCIRGVDKDGEVFQFDILPIGAPTLRYLMIGQLSEALANFVEAEDVDA